VIVDDFDADRLSVDPTETDAILIVDANAPLPGTVTGELFQAVCVRDTEVQGPPAKRCSASRDRRQDAGTGPSADLGPQAKAKAG
jgi:hypothetical protein